MTGRGCGLDGVKTNDETRKERTSLTGGAQPVSGGGKFGKHPRGYKALMGDHLSTTGGAK